MNARTIMDSENDAIEGITARLAKAVSEAEAVTKTKTADTGKYSYTYASLEDVLRTVKDALEKHDLVFIQPIEMMEDGYAQVTTQIIDKLTEDTLTFAGVPFKVMNDPQATGSAITYARRYSLTTLFALATPDDDGSQANRAATRPNARTDAEIQIRKIFKELPDAMAKEDFQAKFVAEFGCTLSQLPENRHGMALLWTKDQVNA